MKIGVISDTHLHSITGLSTVITMALSNVDMIVHTGDFVSLEMYEGMKQLGDVKAVYGNMDSNALKNLLPQRDMISIQGKKIGIVHGWGPPWGIEDRIRDQFDDVDIIFYGHTHKAMNRLIEGTLFFNPGEAWDSYGIVTIEETISGEIIKV